MSTDFDQLVHNTNELGMDQALDLLADELIQQEKYHELFNTRQMQIRWRLGLPVLKVRDSSELPPAIRDQLEEGYITACREVGNLLLKIGNIPEAWSYLQIVGDQQPVAAALEKINEAKVDEESISDLIDIALYQGVAAELGYNWILKHYGTCNAITALENVMHSLPPEIQLSLIGRLVRHLHAELLENVKAGIAELTGNQPEGSSISQLLAEHENLLEEQGYHIDTSHLSSTVQMARVLEDPEDIRLTIEMADYGKRLDSQLKFPGEAPFTDLYFSLSLYLSAMIGNEVDQAVAYFKEQSEAVDIEEDGSLPAEVYITLLARLNRYDEAFDETLRLLPRDVHTTGFGPNLLELAGQSNMPQRLMEICRDQDDLLGFVAGLVDSSSK